MPLLPQNLYTVIPWFFPPRLEGPCNSDGQHVLFAFLLTDAKLSSDALAIFLI